MKIGHNGFSDTKESKMLENISKCSHNVNSTEYLYSVYWAVIMGCLLLLFLSCTTNTWANIKPMCKINRFDTSVEKKCKYSKFCLLLSLLFCFLFLYFSREIIEHPTTDSSKSQRGGSCVFALSRTLSMLKTHEICHWHLFL